MQWPEHVLCTRYNLFFAVYVLGSREIEVGIIVSLSSPNATFSHPRPQARKQLSGGGGARGYAPSPWRSTQVQQGSGFLQELKAAIQLNQLESRAGTITWGRRQKCKPAEWETGFLRPRNPLPLPRPRNSVFEKGANSIRSLVR